MSTQEHEAAARLTCEKIHPWMKDVHLLEPGRYCPSCDGIAAALADAVRVARAEQEERTLHGALAMIDRVVREHRNSSHMMDVPIRQAINQWWQASRKVLGSRAGEGDATAKPHVCTYQCADTDCEHVVGPGDATPGLEPDRCKDVHVETGQRCLEVSPHRMSGEYAMHRSASVSWLTLGESQPAAYPCADCGKLRTEAQGGKTFTVCDDCWDKHYGRATPPKKGRPERCAICSTVDHSDQCWCPCHRERAQEAIQPRPSEER